MEKLEIVSFKQAKELNILGFYEKPAYGFYHVYHLESEYASYVSAAVGWLDKYIYAPTLELVAKWLRDEKNISLEPYRTGCGWICMIVDIPSGTDKYQVGYDDDMGDDMASGQFTTFEKALSAGIDKAIKLLS